MPSTVSSSRHPTWFKRPLVLENHALHSHSAAETEKTSRPPSSQNIMKTRSQTKPKSTPPLSTTPTSTNQGNKPPNHNTPLLKLPPELLIEILTHLEPVALLSAVRASPALRSAFAHARNAILRRLAHRFDPRNAPTLVSSLAVTRLAHLGCGPHRPGCCCRGSRNVGYRMRVFELFARRRAPWCWEEWEI